MHYFKIICLFLFVLFSQVAYAVDPGDLLTSEQAFKVSAKPTDDGNVLISWEIADGYYLYRKKITFNSRTESIHIEHADLPTGEIKNDKFWQFGTIIAHILCRSKYCESDLKAVDVKVDVSGASKCSVYSSESLSADASGASKIVIYGDPPKVKTDLSGASSISSN